MEKRGTRRRRRGAVTPQQQPRSPSPTPLRRVALSTSPSIFFAARILLGAGGRPQEGAAERQVPGHAVRAPPRSTGLRRSIVPRRYIVPRRHIVRLRYIVPLRHIVRLWYIVRLRYIVPLRCIVRLRHIVPVRIRRNAQTRKHVLCPALAVPLRAPGAHGTPSGTEARAEEDRTASAEEDRTASDDEDRTASDDEDRTEAAPFRAHPLLRRRWRGRAAGEPAGRGT